MSNLAKLIKTNTSPSMVDGSVVCATHKDSRDHCKAGRPSNTTITSAFLTSSNPVGNVKNPFSPGGKG